VLHALTKLIAHPSVLSADCLSPDDQAETDAPRLPCHSVFVTYGFHARVCHARPGRLQPNTVAVRVPSGPEPLGDTR